MHNKTRQTKTELLQMLAEAVRNTQPQPMLATQPEPIVDLQPKTKPEKPMSKRSTKTKKAGASAKRTTAAALVAFAASRQDLNSSS